MVVGPGIGLEGNVFRRSLSQEVSQELDLADDASLASPDLMTKLCERLEGRRLLISKALQRLDQAKGSADLYMKAICFHRELSSIPQIDTIVSANWDTFFEDACVATPFHSADDFEFWPLTRRKVFKLHGSLDNFGSIVATRQEHTERYEQLTSGALGNALRAVLAGKTFLYVGWPSAGADFEMVHAMLTQGGEAPNSLHYFVTDEDDKETADAKGATIVVADKIEFLEAVKEHLIQAGELLRDEVFSDLGDAESNATDHHLSFTSDIQYAKHPTAILTGCYQDGLIASLEHIGLTQRSGRYFRPSNVRTAIESYSELRAKHLERRHYMDVAYIDGYQAGLELLLASKAKRETLPAYYVYGAAQQPRDAKECKRLLDRAKEIDRDAYDYCVGLVKRFNLEVEPTHLHHGPFLDL